MSKAGVEALLEKRFEDAKVRELDELILVCGRLSTVAAMVASGRRSDLRVEIDRAVKAGDLDLPGAQKLDALFKFNEVRGYGPSSRTERDARMLPKVLDELRAAITKAGL